MVDVPFCNLLCNLRGVDEYRRTNCFVLVVLLAVLVILVLYACFQLPMGSLAFPLAMYNNARARDIEALVGDVLIRARMWFITMESDKQISSRTTDGRER